MKLVKILGAGIAGMSAANFLSQAGYKATVYEKCSFIGGSRDGDLEGIENWIFSENVSDFIKKIGFNDKKIIKYPVDEFYVHTDSASPILIKNNLPFFNLVKRGSTKECIDYQLYKQCLKNNVRFVFDSKKTDHIDIYATGSNKAAAYVNGINFETNAKNQSHLLLGSSFAPKGYAYMLIVNGEGTVATVFKKNKIKDKSPLRRCINYFAGRNIQFEKMKYFGGKGSFDYRKTKLSHPYFVGEVGGFQDLLFGFGMRFSMLSGVAASKMISGFKVSASSDLKLLRKKMRLSFLNRKLYERLNDEQMFKIAMRFSNALEPLSILENAYKWNLRDLVSLKKIKQKYEIYSS
tara:strand:+ start:4820 stop:5866 length:1047 start_codon:yes stop_codon:yes gene_type:complete